MSILTTFRKRVKKYMSEADERADRRLAKARTGAERERERAKIERERLVAKKEIAEAKAALLRAEAAKKRAAKEVRDIGDGFLSDLRKMLEPDRPVKHRRPRHKTTGRVRRTK